MAVKKTCRPEVTIPLYMHKIKMNRTLKHEFVIFQDSDYWGTSTGAVGKNVQKTLMKYITCMQFSTSQFSYFPHS